MCERFNRHSALTRSVITRLQCDCSRGARVGRVVNPLIVHPLDEANVSDGLSRHVHSRLTTTVK